MDILDMIEFSWRNVGKPIRGRYHDYFGHYHLTFDVEAGRDEFREAFNRIFRRNGLVYQLKADGRIERLAPPALREALASVLFRTGDGDLDRMLETARRKFLDPDVATRREALEALWMRGSALRRWADRTRKLRLLRFSTLRPVHPRQCSAKRSTARRRNSRVLAINSKYAIPKQTASWSPRPSTLTTYFTGSSLSCCSFLRSTGRLSGSGSLPHSRRRECPLHP
jgi:hypothetical protein